MSVVRWIFQEVSTGTTHTVEINPNKASSPMLPKTLTFSSRLDSAGRIAGVSEKVRPKDWTFEGVIFTQTHHDALIEWAKKPGKVRITDHLGRTFEVMMQKIQVTDRRPTPLNDWRFTYSFACLVLRRIA